MRLCLSLFCFTLLLACKKEKAEVQHEVIQTAQKQENTTIQSVNYAELLPYLSKEDDKVYVVNFWATWCKPCVEELPFFERINEEYKDPLKKGTYMFGLEFPFETQTTPKFILFAAPGVEYLHQWGSKGKSSFNRSVLYAGIKVGFRYLLY